MSEPVPGDTFVLLGDPVDHSRSPAIHRAAMEAIGSTGRYVARTADQAGLVAACEEIRSGGLSGANVTMPLKRIALAEVDSATRTAQRAGAVNTLYRVDGAVVGDNTDVGGIVDAWRRRGLPDEGAVLVLGAGGAAAAALVALGGRQVAVSSRRPAMARALVERLGTTATIQPWGRPLEGVVVVNATPLGMAGEQLPPEVVEHAVALFDMAYGAATTPAVRAMQGWPVVDGIDMLVSQAARSFELWHGVAAPIDVMEAAARQ